MNLAVWEHRLAQIPEEMSAALRRGAPPPPPGAGGDHACALCDAAGQLVALSAAQPIHLGSMTTAVQAVLRALPLGPGEVAVVNDPFCGGTQLADMTLVAPVYEAGEGTAGETGAVLAYVAVRAHHAGIGARPKVPAGWGDAPPEAAALPPALGPRYQDPAPLSPPRTLDDEGAHLPPTLLTEAVLHDFAGRSVDPQALRAGLRAQQAALGLGQRRVRELAGRHGAATLRAQAGALRAHAARMTRTALLALPPGFYAFADSLDDDGAGATDIGIRVSVALQDGQATVDFSDTDDEVGGAVNVGRAVTVAAVLYAFRLLSPGDTPHNDGGLGAIRVITRPGSLLDARPPRAVADGCTETAQRVVDVVLGALAQALPARMPAASCGSANKITIWAGAAAGPGAVSHESLAGGAGAFAGGAGASAVHTHMVNQPNLSIEALERALPVRVLRYGLRRGSGGAGVHHGGDGVVRELLLLADVTVALVGERRRRPPYGHRGGGPGATGLDTLTRAGRVIRLPAKVRFAGRAGDVLTVETPGGGGHGDAARAEFWSTLLET